MSLEKHRHLLGALYVAMGLLGLLGAGFLFIAIAGAGAISGDDEAAAITGFVGTLLASLIVLMHLPALVGGYFLLRGREWARLFCLVLGFFYLMHFPFGTAVGGYAIWVLLREEEGVPAAPLRRPEAAPAPGPASTPPA